MKLIRTQQSDAGTFGTLYKDDEQLARTCELPHCIASGMYRVTQYDSPTKGRVFLLHNVPDHDMIEIHVGNTIDDTKGCILVGSSFGLVHGKQAVVNSRFTLEELLNRFPDPFVIEIVEEFK